MGLETFWPSSSSSMCAVVRCFFTAKKPAIRQLPTRKSITRSGQKKNCRWMKKITQAFGRDFGGHNRKVPHWHWRQNLWSVDWLIHYLFCSLIDWLSEWCHCLSISIDQCLTWLIDCFGGICKSRKKGRFVYPLSDRAQRSKNRTIRKDTRSVSHGFVR